MYLDLVTAIIITSLLMISAVLKVRSLHKKGIEELGKTNFENVLIGQTIRVFASLFFFIKFLCFAVWYRCSEKGNIMENTICVFWTRFVMDVVLYFAIGYSVWIEIQLDLHAPFGKHDAE